MRRQILSYIIISVAVAAFGFGCGGGTLGGYNFDDTSGSTGVTTQPDDPDGSEGVTGEPGPAGEDGADGTDGADGRDGVDGVDGADAVIPAGVWLDGVNRISFYASTDGLIVQSADTTAAKTEKGAFNGDGTGNKAFVGLNLYDDVLASAITGISMTVRRDRGTSFFYLNLQVDCDGDGAFGANDGIVVVDSSTLADLALAAGVWTTIDIDPADAVFKMVGGPKASCGNLPSHLGAVGSPLTDLPVTARLWNGSTGDDGMPRATEMAAVLFVMGDSVDLLARTMTIESVNFSGDEYSFQ